MVHDHHQVKRNYPQRKMALMALMAPRALMALWPFFASSLGDAVIP